MARFKLDTLTRILKPALGVIGIGGAIGGASSLLGGGGLGGALGAVGGAVGNTVGAVADGMQNTMLMLGFGGILLLIIMKK